MDRTRFINKRLTQLALIAARVEGPKRKETL
jgi:hypothetical protein